VNHSLQWPSGGLSIVLGHGGFPLRRDEEACDCHLASQRIKRNACRSPRLGPPPAPAREQPQASVGGSTPLSPADLELKSLASASGWWLPRSGKNPVAARPWPARSAAKAQARIHLQGRPPASVGSAPLALAGALSPQPARRPWGTVEANCAHPGHSRKRAAGGLAARTDSRIGCGPWGVIHRFLAYDAERLSGGELAAVLALLRALGSSIQSCCCDEPNGLPWMGHTGAVEALADRLARRRPARRRVHHHDSEQIQRFRSRTWSSPDDANRFVGL